MINARLQPIGTDVPAPARALDPGAAAFLDHLRKVAMGCRVKPRADLFAACAALQTAQAQDGPSEALMRCLGDALGARTRLMRPGTAERSFDEDWLVQLGRACVRGDEASAAFLLGSRLPRESRRMIRFLVERVAGAFDLA